MPLFNNLQEFQEAVRVNNDLDNDTLLMHVDQAKKYVEPWIGSALLDLCMTADDNSDDEITALLPYLRQVMGPFTMVEATPVLDIGISNNGFVVTLNGNQAPASKERVAAFVNQMFITGYDALERLLEYLLAKAGDYDSWTDDTEVYDRYVRHLLRNSQQLKKYVDYSVTSHQFFEAHAKFSEVEETLIAGYISTELTEEMIDQVIADDISEENSAIIAWVRRALANYFVAEIIEESK